MLGGTFELDIQERDTVLSADSGERVWQLFSTMYGPTKVLAESLEVERREQLHRNVWSCTRATGSATRSSSPGPTC